MYGVSFSHQPIDKPVPVVSRFDDNAGKPLAVRFERPKDSLADVNDQGCEGRGHPSREKTEGKNVVYFSAPTPILSKERLTSPI